jgi:serine/threonine protein kinase
MPDVSDTEIPPPRPVKNPPRLLDMAGNVVRDRFEIVRDLGAGISGRVYLATDRELFGREVAIKVLCRREDYIERRFITEAEVLSNVEHPNLVRAIAFGRTDQEYLFMALEYVPGLTLEKHLMRRKWLPWREVVEIGIQLANVLQALHEAGVVHRDVTPYNIVLMDTPKGPRPKLIDLGVAYLNDEFRAAQEAVFSDLPPRHPTQAGFAVGSPKYRPEDAPAYPKDPSLDVWGLAVTLYQLCTGARPDETGGRTIPDVVPDNDAPEFLSRLLLSAVTPDRADRLTSALELERGLAAVRDAHPEQPPAHLFGGCFDRIELLGKGSCAMAYRANDRNLSRECVVKILRADSASPDNRIRFRRSAKILSALSNDVIPKVYYYGIADGQPFMAMERCPGVSAAEFVTGRQLDASEIVEIGIQLAGALGECHEAGVLYRDLYPPNVLIQRGRTPRAYLFDFDAALVLPHMYARLTERWGTPPEERLEPSKDIDLRLKDYVGPEIRAGGDFTPANDVYALGLLLYRFLTGKRPCFPGDTMIIRPREQIDDCPDSLDDLLYRMLAAHPGARPPISEVVRLLKEAALEIKGEIPEAADPPPAPAPTPTPGPATLAESAPVPTPGEPAAAVSPEPTLDVAPERAPVMAPEPAPAIAPASAVGSMPAAAPTSVRRRIAVFAAAGVLVVAAIGVLASMRAAPSRVAPDDSQPAPEGAASGESERPALASAVPPTVPAAPEARDGTPAPPSVPPAESTAVTPQQAKARPKKTKGAADTVPPATVAAAADQARGKLRQNCAGAPASFTVEIVASDGRGSVRSINGLPPAGEGWQACARRELERVPYPASAPSSPVRLRLQLQAQPGQGAPAER